MRSTLYTRLKKHDSKFKLLNQNEGAPPLSAERKFSRWLHAETLDKHIRVVDIFNQSNCSRSNVKVPDICSSQQVAECEWSLD